MAAVDLSNPPGELDFALESRFGEEHIVMLPMADGTKLATDYITPKGEGPFPSILQRTPYGRSLEDGLSTGLLEQGYAIICQDHRGRFDSEGIGLAFKACGWGEHQDGYDTVEWIAAQPWSNGKVGTFGASAGGITQNLMAGAAPPHLTCQVVLVASANFYEDTAYPGGAFRKQMVEGWLEGNNFPPETLQEMLDHPTEDSYWDFYNVEKRAPEITVPSLQLGGWFDCFESGPIRSFLSRQIKGGEGARGNQVLIMGPWTHGGMFSARQGELEFPSVAVARVDLMQRLKDFFAFWLKGEQNGAMENPVTYYEMGACGEPGAPGHMWQTSSTWPPPARSQRFFLTPAGGLSKEAPTAEEAQLSYVSDPSNPVPNHGGHNLILPAGSFDQREIEARDDVLTFTTEPLTQPLNLTGQAIARLFVASTAVDTDFVVKLCDVYPDGRSMLISEGVLRARYRGSFQSPELLTPGQVYELEVPLWDTSLVFNTGHRIRLDVQSSDFPRYDANTQTGIPYGQPAEPVVATNTVFFNAEQASCLDLPVMLGE